MSIYTTPLQFGYFLALLYAVLLWVRGWREERLSDSLLGWVMLLLGQQIQDYTFGFAGINVLWEEMNGFPRSTNLLLGPAFYFYLRSQLNDTFRLQRSHALHLLPLALFFVTDLAIFVQGPATVAALDLAPWAYPYEVLGWLVKSLSLGYYFWQAYRLYRDYRHWMSREFSDTETLSFGWYRNFIVVMVSGLAFKELMLLADLVFDWDFYQDWWWNLGFVAIICYVSVSGYAQPQPRRLIFDPPKTPLPTRTAEVATAAVPEQVACRQRLESYMQTQRPSLDPLLTLSDLARQAGLPASLVSATLNQTLGMHFNDYVNSYRIRTFQALALRPDQQHLTLLALAFDSGFNSKATFNRAFRKHTGTTPRAWLDEARRQQATAGPDEAHPAPAP
ncbi:MAG: hypothetical protein OHK0039_20250 [Bacteroidia bacterium]